MSGLLTSSFATLSKSSFLDLSKAVRLNIRFIKI